MILDKLKLFLFEKWKDVIDYEGYYQISNFGRLRSVDRFVINKMGVKRKLKGSLKNTYQINGGYLMVSLGKKGINKAYLVHKLVANAFLLNPFNYKQINHKNGNKKDNILNNLEWCTARENTHHARQKMKSSSNYIGVSFSPNDKTNPWVSRITINGKIKYIGRYSNEKLAYEAYLNECKINNIKIKKL
jgi:hypothetical protein